ncbi:MAG: RNA-protein complex protein Nop10 [Methanomassiliicoccales archaeon]|jgi:H/ACA ribonucleoprotein complex subunit 3
MRTSLRKCPKCQEYTLGETCPRCGRRSVVATPPKFSPEDRYGTYRRRLRKERGDDYGVYQNDIL